MRYYHCVKRSNLSIHPDFFNMIKYTVESPYGHNPQTWKFVIKGSSIDIPDL
jgi:hypothetical protein